MVCCRYNSRRFVACYSIASAYTRIYMQENRNFLLKNSVSEQSFWTTHTNLFNYEGEQMQKKREKKE